MEETKKISNPRMHNPDGIYASDACREDCFELRDHFAGLAMQAMLSNSSIVDNITFDVMDYVSSRSYQMANNMLKDREKR